MLLKKVYFEIIKQIINSKVLHGTRFFKLKNTLLKSVGVKVGLGVKIVGPFIFNYGSYIEIGENTWIGKDFEVYGNGDVIISNNCDFGPNVKFITGSHKIDFMKRRAGEGIKYNYSVGTGSWIGANVTISNGATIGNGVVVGVSSLVIKDCKDHCLYVGSPSKKIKELQNE